MLVDGSSPLYLLLWECFDGKEIPCFPAELLSLLELTQPVQKEIAGSSFVVPGQT